MTNKYCRFLEETGNMHYLLTSFVIIEHIFTPEYALTVPDLTKQQARLVQLAAQGLLTPPAQPATREDVLAAILRMGLLQIDTIHVVARSPYFVLFSRLGDYNSRWLDELLVEKALFEQWAHAACYIPMEDFPLARRLILEELRLTNFGAWGQKNLELVNQVLEAVRANGAMRSVDFESKKESGGWWNWKTEKTALEYWFWHGELMVAKRENFQRVYDLAERVLPDWTDDHVPPLDEVYRQMIRRTVRALGVARPSWVADYYRLKKKVIPPLLQEMLNSGDLRQVTIEGWAEPALFVAENEPLVLAAANNELHAAFTTLLSPFDPLTWDRERARQLFNFDFIIQCYTPAAKRQYGYFPLPILHHGELVGRLDAKAHRKERIFEVKSLFLEDGAAPTIELALALGQAFQRSADWHQTPQVTLGDCHPNEFKPLLQSVFDEKPR